MQSLEFDILHYKPVFKQHAPLCPEQPFFPLKNGTAARLPALACLHSDCATAQEQARQRRHPAPTTAAQACKLLM